MPKKIRTDALLMQQGLADSPEAAAKLVMAGLVYTGTKRLDKPGTPIDSTLELTVKGHKPHPWVSRGGIKLAHGLKHFNINPQRLTALDVGSSTGGFTDVLLYEGAAKVYAVDVGYGELDWKLRNDARVIVLERTNARHLTEKEIPEPIQIIVCDASFINLHKVLPTPLSFAADAAVLIALIKPQFEVEKHEVGENGIITDPALHARVCEEAETFIRMSGWEILGITPSPIKGMEGNTEFLIGARKRHG